MTKPLNILTFNWHEPYICLLSRTGHHFFVVIPHTGNGPRNWDEQMRPVPSNVTIVNIEEAKQGLAGNSYDLAVCNNIQDIFFIQDFQIPFVKVYHNKLKTEAGLSKNPPDLAEYKAQMKELSSRGVRVFISENKKIDWGFEGEVITPGIDVDDYSEKKYEGDLEQALVVGNLVKERDLMMGYTDQLELLQGIPSFLMGLNPTIPGSRVSKGWEDLKEHFRHLRFYLNTTVDEYEDGYNLAMLEAMATGMPVVSTHNATSPIVDGKNGFVSQDKKYLKEKIKELLGNPELARKIGEQGRQTILEKFNINDFTDKWNRAISKALKMNKEQETRTRSITIPKAFKVRNILLSYTYFPATTAFYLERGLRKHFNVKTVGATIDKQVIELWKLENMKKELRQQDIPTDYCYSVPTIMNSLPEGFKPDIFLWCETGIEEVPKNLDKLGIPVCCYLVDTHTNLERHLDIASHFDFAFIAQKEYVPKFTELGIRCFWLPLGCDPEIHGKKGSEKKYDIGFVGTIKNSETRRAKLIDSLSEKFSVHIERCFHEEMAQLFSESKMVFNNCIRDDLNMRIFEAMCSGTMLLTDAPKNSGFDEMFQDGKHLAVYEDDNIADVAAYYMEHEEEREKIAFAGQQEVLAKHTYERRVLEMIDVIEGEINKIARGKAPHKSDDPLLEAFQELKVAKDYEAIIAEFETSKEVLTSSQKEKISLIASEAYAMTGNFKKAKGIYAEILGSNDSSCEALIGLGTLAIQEQNAEEAYRTFQRVLELDGKNSKALCGNGISLIMQGFVPESKAFFAEALDADINNTIALNQMITVSHALENYVDAVSYLEKYLELHQTALDYCYTLATLYFVMGNAKQAHEQVEKILLFEPENENALELIAKINNV